jgi:hypothetical protein
MSKQKSGFSRHEMSDTMAGFRLRRKVLSGIAAMLMGASLVFTGSAYAHNIDLAKAREVVREYARKVRDESGGKFLHYSTNCVRAFPGGHNHFVRCVIEYQNAKDTAAGVYTCKESVEVYMRPHQEFSVSYQLYAKHTSAKCGSHSIDGPIP